MDNEGPPESEPYDEEDSFLYRNDNIKSLKRIRKKNKQRVMGRGAGTMQIVEDEKEPLDDSP